MAGPQPTENTRQAIAYCLAHLWLLGVLTHKLIDIP
jgi:hypothetical protein